MSFIMKFTVVPTTFELIFEFFVQLVNDQILVPIDYEWGQSLSDDEWVQLYDQKYELQCW